ncbi:Ig-like domain-containing protein [Phenylobacterium deserti]|uniref:Ig-like domain-containing protein n=1 Tax=Phenylobacterium deserti TaxID=1914756 RepID=UPI0014022C6F|nr:Ig-like domain-containing protein [Phenylobacterium deserti]
MTIKIQFEDVPAGLLTGYSAQGFNFTSLFAPNDPTHEAFWNRSYLTDLGTGAYLINQQSSDTITVRASSGQAFGAVSIDVNGFNFKGFDGEDPITGTQVVTFTFQGLKAGSYDLVEYSFTTDNVDSFQTVALPGAFSSGLLQLSWSVSGASENWGAFDNLVLQPNRAPTVQSLNTSVTGGETYTGHLLGSDPDGQALIFKAVGALPKGVVLDSDGTFYVQPLASDEDLMPGESRTVSFQFKASDGALDSTVASVTVKVGALPQGADICGGNHPQTLVGTAAGERICGGNSGDVLSGMGGADTLMGNNGKDLLMGGGGRDLLLGGNGSDTLDGGAGDDTLTGGNSPDLFIFERDFGRDVITDFDVKNETIQMSPAMFANFADLKAHAVQSGAHVVITYDAANILTLQNVKLSSLNEGDFIFA